MTQFNIYSVEFTMSGIVIKFLCSTNSRSTAESIIESQMKDHFIYCFIG